MYSLFETKLTVSLTFIKKILRTTHWLKWNTNSLLVVALLITHTMTNSTTTIYNQFIIHTKTWGHLLNLIHFLMFKLTCWLFCNLISIVNAIAILKIVYVQVKPILFQIDRAMAVYVPHHHHHHITLLI